MNQGKAFGDRLHEAMRASSERRRWIKQDETSERVNARLREIVRGATTSVDDSEALGGGSSEGVEK